MQEIQYECLNNFHRCSENYNICMHCRDSFCNECENRKCNWCELQKLPTVECPNCSINIDAFGESICIGCFVGGIYNSEIMYCYDCKKFIQYNDLTHKLHNIQKNKYMLIEILYFNHPESKDFHYNIDL